MIQSWKISNFKAVPGNRNEPLDLRQLNILVGPNSSGKSTLLQSILMVAQTLRNSSGERPLILNGDLVRLGHADEVIHEGDDNLPLKLEFSFLQNGFNAAPSRAINAMPIKVSAEFKLPREKRHGFDLARATIKKGEDIGVIAEKMHEKILTSQISDNPDWQIDQIIKNKINKHWFDYMLLTFSSGANTRDYNRITNGSFAPKISLFHFLPGSILQFYGRDNDLLATALRFVANQLMDEKTDPLQDLVDFSNLRESSKRLIVEAIRKTFRKVIDSYQPSARPAMDLTLRPLINDLSYGVDLRTWIQIANQKLSTTTKRKISQQLRYEAAEFETRSRSGNLGSEENIGIRENPMPPEINLLVQEIVSFFTERVKYLGPLRDDPRAIYGIPANPETKDVGVKGEFTAAVLERYKEELVESPFPPDSEHPLGKTHPTNLSEAISEWLRYMDLVEEVTTHDLGKIGFELKVRSRGVGKELDLTNVGVGVSQVLPTLVAALLSPQDSLLLLEQPELHLHPKVQSRLGDFILCIALSGKQCIVETHSEYLVNRIRRRIAESEARTILDKTSLYFVERGEQGAEFTKVEPNEFGAILSWPKGFFDEGPAEAELIMAAAMKKRQLTRKIQGNGG